MISRWNYLAITTVMLVVFFLFQFTNVALESWDGYEENSYYQDRDELLGESSAYKFESGESETGAATENPRERVVYIGAVTGNLEDVVCTWTTYTKRSMASYESLEAYEKAEQKSKASYPEMLILNAEDMDWNQKELCGILEACVDAGTDLVFCNLPEVSVIKDNARLRKLLGIEQVKEESAKLEGVYLKEGFLLGGEAVYRAEDEEENEKRQDMELTFPYYILGKNAETYMRGITKELLKEEEDYPAVIWRNSFNKAHVFAVNGGYMEDVTGMGLLTAMASRMNDYEIYPVVNAQNMVIVNYPGFASENNAEIKARYGQTMSRLLRDVAWPSIVAVYRQNTLGLSCMLTPQYDYEDDSFPNQTELKYYMRRIREQGAEAGLSGNSISDMELRRKLIEDQRFMGKELPDYRVSSFYAGGLEEKDVEAALNEEILEPVRTVVTDYHGENDLISFQTEDITRQSTLSDGTEHTYREDFRMRSVQTALGYSSVRMDMGRVAYPEGEEDTLEKVLSEFGGNIQYYWQNFKGFSGTTVSECDDRIRNFLALDYTDSRKDNVIHLESNAGNPVWFVLRTQNERITHVDGGSWKQLEDGAWLIEAENSDVKIELE